MSTPSITAPVRRRLDDTARHPAVGSRLRRLVRGQPADPAWSRPALVGIAVLAGLLVLWGLTRNGYANSYYAEAVQAGSHSWKALLTNSLDASGFVSLDKGPLSLWMMGLSGRLFGFSSLSMLLPDAACGVAAVLVLHNLVRRTLGHRAAVLAALMLALSPVAVAVSRFNNPDALLVLLLVCAAWAMVRALESGRTRDLLLCGALVGLAFNTKMLEAYLVVPGLSLAYLLGGPAGIRRRVGQLLAAGGSMLVVSFAWFATMMLLPAADRPWVGDTTGNSWFELIFGANGLSRVSGSSAGSPGGGPDFGGSAGPLRLLNSAVGAQIAWLLPLAVVGLLTGLWLRRHAARSDPRRAAYVLWGGWALVCYAVFSFSSGIFHPYYTSMLAPALAVLAAGGLVALWEARRSGWAAWLLAAAILSTASLGFVLLGRSPSFLPWLRWVLLACGAAAALGLVVARRRPARLAIRRRVGVATAALGLIAVIGGPGSYAVASVGHPTSGSNPLGGPASISQGGGGFGGGRPEGRAGPPACGEDSPALGLPGWPAARHPVAALPAGLRAAPPAALPVLPAFSARAPPAALPVLPARPRASSSPAISRPTGERRSTWWRRPGRRTRQRSPWPPASR